MKQTMKLSRLQSEQFTSSRGRRRSDPKALRHNFTSDTASVSSEEHDNTHQTGLKLPGLRINRSKVGGGFKKKANLRKGNSNPNSARSNQKDQHLISAELGDRSWPYEDNAPGKTGETSRVFLPNNDSCDAGQGQKAASGKLTWKKIFNKKKQKDRDLERAEEDGLRTRSYSTDSHGFRQNNKHDALFSLPDEQSTQRSGRFAVHDDGTGSVSAGTVKSGKSFHTFGSCETPVLSNLSKQQDENEREAFDRKLEPHSEEEPQHQEGQELVYDAVNDIFTLGDEICPFPEASASDSPARKSSFVFSKMNLGSSQRAPTDGAETSNMSQEKKTDSDSYPLERRQSKPKKNMAPPSSRFVQNVLPESKLQSAYISATQESDAAAQANKTDYFLSLERSKNHHTAKKPSESSSLFITDSINGDPTNPRACGNACGLMFATTFSQDEHHGTDNSPNIFSGTSSINEHCDRKIDQIKAETKRNDETSTERTIKTMQTRGADLMKRRKSDEALAIFKELELLVTDFYGKDHEQLGNVWHNKAIVLTKAGRYSEAVSACNEAVRIRKKALGNQASNVAVSLSQLGIAHMESGDFPPSLRAFRAAFEIREATLGPTHPKVAKLHNNIGCVLFEIQDLKAAEISFGKALSIQREMLKSNPPNVDQVLLSVASTQCNIGSIKLSFEQIDDALITLEDAMMVQQSVLGDKHKAVLSTKKSIEHALKLRDMRMKKKKTENLRPPMMTNQEGSVEIATSTSRFCEF
jgi:tetratricopeptide (TPR) repeat protein